MTTNDFVNWYDLWNEPEFEQTYLAWPLIPAERVCALNGEAKAGKSLIVLEAAACIASGRDFCGHPTIQGTVLYLDFENHPRVDVRPRLTDMGFGPDELTNLRFASFPNLPAFDTPAATDELNNLLDKVQPVLVIVDTISRIVEGEENSNDTWNKLFKYSETLMKRRGVTWLRLDHTGKTDTKGARGGSAKSGTADLSWKFTERKSGVYSVKAEFQRMPLELTEFELNRLTTPCLHHSLVLKETTETTNRVEAAIQLLDENGYPHDLTQEKTGDVLREVLKFPIGNTLLAKVCQSRRVSQPLNHLPKNPKIQYESEYTQNENYEGIADSEYPSIDEFEMSDADYKYYYPEG
jgi:hypothetical protein